MTVTAETVADYAQTLVLQVRAGGVELDFSEGSLATVERLFQVSEPLLALPQLPDSPRNLLVFYTGCYVGEVLCRCFGGVWSFPENWFEATLTFATPTGGIQLSPFEKVLLRAIEPSGNDLTVYASGLRERLHPNNAPRE